MKRNFFVSMQKSVFLPMKRNENEMIQKQNEKEAKTLERKRVK
jgi:hypothetical protein